MPGLRKGDQRELEAERECPAFEIVAARPRLLVFPAADNHAREAKLACQGDLRDAQFNARRIERHDDRMLWFGPVTPEQIQPPDL